MSPKRVFVSYRRFDSQWVEQGGQLGLIPWLAESPLLNGAEFWWDHALKERPGAEYEKLISQRIEMADWAILLLSQDFANSTFIREKELPWIHARAQQGDLRVIPLYVGLLEWSTLGKYADWIRGLQILPDPQTPPLISIAQHPARWQEARQAILRGVANMLNPPPAPPPPPPPPHFDTGSHGDAPTIRWPVTTPPTPPDDAPDPEPWGFDMSDSSPMRMWMEQRMLKAKRIVLIGTGLNILHNDPFLHRVMEYAASGRCALRIYLADPSSSAVQNRLIEEELGSHRPPVGRPGLVSRLKTLSSLWEELGRPSSIKLRVFQHYPTFAVLIVDDQYLFYPYGYARLGNFSPVFRFVRGRERDKAAIDFLDEHCRLVKQSAIDLQSCPGLATSLNPDALVPMALFFIPPQHSALYRFGSEVLGYDVRRSERRQTPWSQHVRGAGAFGFHLTMADVLYFANQAQVAAIKAEVAFLLRDFQPIVLGDLKLRESFPSARAVGISVSDPTGALEALHAELVHRVYARSAASNYSLRRAPRDRDGNYSRAQFMIHRYRAPYILRKFDPHFTLLDTVTQTEQPQCVEKLQAQFRQAVEFEPIAMESLAVMTGPAADGCWRIDSELPLG